MTTMKKVVTFVALILGCIVAGSFIYFHVSEKHLLQQVSLGHQSFAEHLTQLQQSLPLGVSHEEVVKYLQDHGMSFYESQQTLYVKLGTVPSTAWYCDSWSIYADFIFDGDTSMDATHRALKQLSSEQRGDNCL
jgi:hypothetical protein